MSPKHRSALGSKRVVGTDADGRDVWEVAMSSGYRSDGRQRRVTRRIHGTERDAQRALVLLAEEMGRTPTLGDSMSLDDYFWSTFLPGRKARTTRANVETCQSVYRCHIASVMGNADIGSIDNITVQRWIDRLPPQSAPTYVRVLRSILNQAAFDHVISESPMGAGYAFRLPRGRRKAPLPVWGVGEVTKCLDALSGDRLYPLWLVMVGAGLSSSEALAVSWDDVSWSEVTGMDGQEHHQATVSVRSAYTSRDGMKEPKNDRRYRSVPVAQPFSDAFWGCRSESGPLCVGKQGGRMSPNYLPKRWKRLFSDGRALHDLPFVGINRMRATYSTLMQSAGVDHTVINAMQGRSRDSKVLYSNYLNPYGSTFDSSADALSRVVSGS